jgi:hypothetical protein
MSEREELIKAITADSTTPDERKILIEVLAEDERKAVAKVKHNGVNPTIKYLGDSFRTMVSNPFAWIGIAVILGALAPFCGAVS